MLTAFKEFLRMILPPILYFAGIVTIFLTFFKNVEWGFISLVALIPQPNVWYSLHQFPLGHDFVDFLFFSILFGIFIQKKSFDLTKNGFLLIIFMGLSYISLINSSMRFSLPFPLSTSNILLPDWKNYVQMIFLYFLALNVMKKPEKQTIIIVLVSIVVLFISIRSYRNFSGGASFDYSKRVGGPFESAGLGANHFGAFIVYTTALFLGLFLFDKNLRRRILYLTTCLFGLHPLFYSYSRGAYLSALGVLAFMGIVKKRSLLLLLAVILLTWQTLLPVSVVDRITMTETENGELEGSASHRLDLWKHALNLFKANPVFGIGFGGFGFTVPQGELTDTHNFYMKTLSEQGVIGLTFLALILLLAMLSGWRLFRTGKTEIHQGLGFGFMGMVIAIIIANLFGDRWSYFSLGGYFWIFWGLVDRGNIISKSEYNG